MGVDRRRFLQAGISLLAVSGLGACQPTSFFKPKVVVVGGGFGGVTVARYLAKWAKQDVDITLFSDVSTYTVCPSSNLYIGDLSAAVRQMGYQELRQRGVNVRIGKVTGVDRSQQKVMLSGNQSFSYDYLVLAPGVDFLPDTKDIKASGLVIAAWRDTEEINRLARSVHSLKHDDTVVITVPLAPYKCPSAPYERACLIANYIQRRNINARVIILDENRNITSKASLFYDAFQNYYPDIIDYRAESEILSIDSERNRISTAFEEIEATLINRIPAQKAGQLLFDAGLIPEGKRWCPVDWQTMQSLGDEQVYVVGDAVESVYALPKSAHVANSQAKVCAAAIIRRVQGLSPFPEPIMMNCCFSHVTDQSAIHLAAVCRYDLDTERMQVIKASHQQSDTDSELEAIFAREWQANILSDSFGV